MILKSVISLVACCMFAFTPVAAQVGNDADAAVQNNMVTEEALLGRWTGPLRVNAAVSLILALNVFKDNETGLSATLDSLDQNALGIVVDPFAMTDTKVTGLVPSIGASFEFELSNDALVGTFIQGSEFPLTLRKTDQVEEPQERPQEVALVRDYIIEEVSFAGGALDVVLAGEFTKPRGEGPFPAVVLITGSGAQDRNEALLGHKPFLILSDHLTNEGFAVLRFDDRGVAQSTGDFATATTFDFADDAAAALTYLKTRPDVDIDRLGYVGHSEGGLVAPLAHKTTAANFAVLLASPTESFAKTITRQTSDILRMNGASESVIKARRQEQEESFIILSGDGSLEEKETALRSFLAEKQIEQSEIDRQVLSAVNSWFITALNYDPIPDLEAMDVPVFGVFAETDLQVSAAANAPAMKASLTNPKSKVVTLEGLNHLFQPSESGAPSEYASIEITWDPGALEIISTWLKDVAGLEP
ncbi:MAG: alpha/beta fold hydrolase [Pseudomonadota bacterium]